jgi:hypothetical protein
MEWLNILIARLRALFLNNYPFTVIGVAPQGFHGVEVGVAPEYAFR